MQNTKPEWPMKKFFNIYGQINHKLLDRLTEFVNQLENDDEVFVTIDSEGGNSMVATGITIMLSALDNVTLVASGAISSSALQIFIFTKCREKIVGPSANGTWHKGWCTESFQPGIRINQKAIKQLAEVDKKEIELMTGILTPEEINQYIRGGDVILDFHDLKKIAKLNLKKDGNYPFTTSE